MEGANPCPRCQEVAVVFDFVQGVLACERCGAVVDEEQLVQHVEFNEKTGAEGVLVGEGDTGERAGAFALPRRGAGLAIQRSHLSGSEVGGLPGRALGYAVLYCTVLTCLRWPRHTMRPTVA